jgi:S-adenosylmethionine:tRNA ribosyltransferase-isomerase
MSPSDWRPADFDYHLPPDLIASRPPERRDAARMLVVDRAAGTIRHRQFLDFPEFLRTGDTVVLNDTRVVKARFFSADGSIELLRLDVAVDGRWRCLVKPGRRMRPGQSVRVGESTGTVTGIEESDGARWIAWDVPPEESLHGHLALPHYLGRGDDIQDEERYQTSFSRSDRAGAIAAPTAGLHFTPEMLHRLPHCFLTLHVGVGTFRPVKADRVMDHVMHREEFELGREAATAIQSADRVVAVGTTVTRVLEHIALQHDGIVPDRGSTDIFIYPPFEFRAVGALLTNFHLPQSTLIMLVSAFAGRDLVLEAYAQAVREKYRFFSYGDCMLLI